MADHPYQGRVRVRVNGLLVRNDALLMVKIFSPVTQRHVWIPPGGGVEYGESMEDCLAREFKEETGLAVEVGELRHINELIKPPFHAIEFYFEVKEKGGSLELGTDPEQSAADQILEDVQFISLKEFTGRDIAPEYVKKQFVEDYKAGITGIRFSSGDR